MGKNVYVVKTNDGFGVKVQGNDKNSKNFETQKQAIKYGRERAQENHSELKIQGRDGKWRDSDSYGKDPNPPKDRKH